VSTRYTVEVRPSARKQLNVLVVTVVEIGHRREIYRSR
jgi:mRNA-degrading endonuclease RelE of RelBE toxin-antitoxin system